MPKKYAKPNRKKRKHLTSKQQAFVKELASGRNLTDAAKAAGYTDKNPGQAGYQALAQLRGRVPELLERHGLGEEVLIEKYLKPLLEAEETKFFKGGKVRINVEALAIRHASLRTAFELHGSYAPRDPKEAAHFGVKVIYNNLGLIRDGSMPVMDIKPGMKVPDYALVKANGNKGMKVPELPTHATTGAKPAVPENGERPTDKRGHD